MLRPFVCAVLDAQKLYNVVHDAIRDDVWGARDREFSCAFNSPNASRGREHTQSASGSDDEPNLL